MSKTAIISILYLLLVFISCNEARENENTADSTSSKNQKQISLGYHNRIYDFKKLSDENYLIHIKVEDSLHLRSKDASYLVKFKPNGDTLSSKKINFSKFQTTFQDLNGFLYIVVADLEVYEGYGVSYLNKYDKKFNKLWQKKISMPEGRESNSILIPNANKELIYISTEVILSDTNSLFPPHSEYLTFKIINTNGEIVSEKNYPSMHNFYSLTVTPTRDENFIVTAAMSNKDTSQLWVLKLNQLGDTLWTKLQPKLEVKSAIENSKNELILFGDSYYPISESGKERYLEIRKLNNEGANLWSRKIEDHFYANAGNIIESSNDHCLFSSAVWPSGNDSDNPFVFEMNNDGEITFEKKFNFKMRPGCTPYLTKDKRGAYIFTERRTVGEVFHETIQIDHIEK